MQRNLFTSLAILFLLTQNLFSQSLIEQKKEYTRTDSLRGGLRAERTCFDVTFYELNIKVDTDKRSIAGSNKIRFNTVHDFSTLQIDLYQNLKVNSITKDGKELKYRREFNAIFVDMPEMKKGSTGELIVNYEGKPTEAIRPPWDGGFTWSKDNNGKLWMGVSCEGMGASLWWPCKDYLGDEPDSMRIICTIPNGLKCVSNGVEEREVANDSTTTFYWKVSYPINNYNVTLNIADYAHFSDEYIADDGSKLALDYYVLPYNLDKAKLQFMQVKPMLKCYEKYLGKYPFWNDGYALVETPYVGMEHQGAIAYGNNYKTGYSGRDYSRIGLDFDYIIIHESAHEWWGNSVSCSDLADMWIHEGFATYTEAIYVECQFGSDTALKYINAKRSGVGNKGTVVGIYGVNEEGSGDMYSKGMLFLHTLRHIVNNDKMWWSTIKGMCDTTFKFKNIGYDDVVNYFNKKTKRDLSPIFDQYLRHKKIPVLQYSLKKIAGDHYEFSYRWETDEKYFSMPFFVATGDKEDKIFTGTNNLQRATIVLNKKNELNIRDDLGYFDIQKE
ncbi:MAG: aminopeptidase [Bacteroidota bacterium]|nr:aminopeptidase [Bacteroidota bacterium]